MTSDYPGRGIEYNRESSALAAVPEYRQHGHEPFPLPAGKKKPPPDGITGRDGAPATEADYARWEREDAWGNIALVLDDGFVGVDLDLHSHWLKCSECRTAIEGLSPRDARETTLKQHGYDPLPANVRSTSRDNGSGIYILKVPPGTELNGKLDDGLGELVQWWHRYVVCWPSIHPDTGLAYRWLGDDDNEAGIPDVSKVPDMPASWIERHRAAGRDRTTSGYDGSEKAWFVGLAEGEMDGTVRAALESRAGKLHQADTEGGSRHDEMVQAVAQLVTLGADYHQGAGEAIEEYKAQFIEIMNRVPRAGDDEGPTNEINRAIKTAISKYGRMNEWFRKKTKVRSPQKESADFWHSHPQLTYIFDIAREQMVAPWAALGAVLARVVAGSDWRIALPAIVCSKTSLNLFVAITGESGDGKGGAMSLAQELVPWDIFTCGAGTGEGLCAAFVHRQPVRQGGNIIYDRSNALIELEEIESLTAVADRKGASILPELRKAWMGEKLGFNNRQRDTNLPVEKRSYRMGLVAGAQAEKSGVLLNDLGGGLTQRCLFLPGDDTDIDPDEPRTPREIPDVVPLDLSLPSAPGVYGPSNAWAAATQVVDVWPEAAWHIRQARRDRKRGETSRAVDGHRLLMKEKVAWALGQITGADETEIREEDWHRAEVVMAVHDAAYDALLDAQKQASRQANTMRAHGEAEREVIKGDLIRQQAVKRVAAAILRRVRKEALTRNPLRKVLASYDREYFDDALSLLLDSGQVEMDDSGRYSEAA